MFHFFLLSIILLLQTFSICLNFQNSLIKFLFLY
nr:MAG TPA: hypothetical protein [Caudoviricetes sp.]DAY29645.1 MAG TPA: hypothetical protein [Caudoviricetes sp.]